MPNLPSLPPWLTKNKDLPNKDLLQAAQEGNKAKVVKLLSKGADVDATDKYGWTPLHYACNLGHVEVVEALLVKGANVNATNKYGWTPLHRACYSGHVVVVKALLAKGANLDPKNEEQLTPLLYACSLGHVEVVKALLAKGANVDVTDKDGSTPLLQACALGHLELVEALLAKRATIHTTNKRGWTPMHNACLSGNVEVVKVLLSKGADIETSDSWGKTPLDVAKTHGKEDVVNFLHSHANGNAFSGHRNKYSQSSQSSKIDADIVLMKATSPDPPAHEDQFVEVADRNQPQMDMSLQLTDDDILFLRKGKLLLKDGDAIPLISEQEKIAIKALATNIMDFERSLESVRELPASLDHKSPEISTYYFFFTHAFERMIVAAQVVSTRAVTLQLDWRDGMLETLLGGASIVAERNDIPFLGCISIFSAIIMYQRRTKKANIFIAFDNFFRGRSRDQYLLTYRKLAEKICLRLDLSTTAEKDLSNMETYKKRVHEMIKPIQKHLRKVHLLSIENLSAVEARAMKDLSSATKEVLRLHQTDLSTYQELCSSDESVKASYLADIVCGKPSGLVNESPTNNAAQDNSQKPFAPQDNHNVPTVVQSPCHNENPESAKQVEKTPISEDEIQQMRKQIECNNRIALGLQHKQEELHKLIEEVRGKKDVSVSSGCQAQLFINPHRPREEIQELENRLHQIESDVKKINSQQDLIHMEQEKQYRELEKLKLETFIKTRVLSFSEAYEFTERLLMNACGRDGKPLNIFVADDGRFEFNGKKYHIGVLQEGSRKKSFWKGRIDIKLEDRHQGINSIMEWFDQTELRHVYERNKKQAILLMFKDELNEPHLSETVKPFHSQNDQDTRDEIFDPNLCPNLK